MGGGSSAPSISRGDPDWLEKRISIDRERYEANVNEMLKEFSAELGVRDSESIHRHVETIRNKLDQELAETVEIQFGGSLSKHTYVDGISDVDALILLKRDDVEDRTPEEILAIVAGLVKERLPETRVRVGPMAVTIAYADGVELQLLPAIKRGERVQVPGGDGEWSPIAHPRQFAQELKRVNARCSFAVVPTIKLFKAVQDSKIPKDARLKGYHTEALAVEAFATYNGPRERKEMLRHLARFAVDRVLRPIDDSTRQSRHADEYLGGPNSQGRKTASTYLARLLARMESADKTGDVEAWARLFGED